MITKEYIEKIFKPVLTADWPTFFNAVHDKIHWVIPGNCEMSGDYHGKAAIVAAWSKISHYLDKNRARRIIIDRILIDGDYAVVEMHYDEAYSLKGTFYPQTYCWVMRFTNDLQIIELTAHVDTQLIHTIMNE